MCDDDLWVAPPEIRLEIPEEEAVKEWREAYNALGDLMPFADRIGLGMMAAVSDALERVGIALERAKERVRQAQEEE